MKKIDGNNEYVLFGRTRKEIQREASRMRKRAQKRTRLMEKLLENNCK